MVLGFLTNLNKTKMGFYKYKARDKFGRLAAGSLNADTQDIAIKNLKDMGYVPISVKEVKEVSADKILQKFRRISLDELSAFTRQLYSLQNAGLPLLSSLEAIAQQVKTRYFSTIIKYIANDIRSGLSFSQAIAKYPQVFNEIYLGMIKAAEASGALPAILERLISLIEQDIDTRSKIKSATRYPMIAFSSICAGFTILVIFVIPKFAALYAQFNALLPLPTRILIAINIIMTKYWYLMILGIIGASFGFMRFVNSKTGRPIWDNFKIKVPVFGNLMLMLLMSRFARITGILMKSGVPILEVLNLAANVSGNIIISRVLLNIKESVNQGKGISEPMKVSGLFPAAIVQMVNVGEKTGKVDDLLLGVADYYDRESSYIIKNLTTYIEPMLILILGIMVLILALGIFMPMWNLIRVFSPS